MFIPITVVGGGLMVDNKPLVFMIKASSFNLLLLLSLPAATRKRHKKEREKTWEPDERRGSGRRGSGSRHRERSPEDSYDESPPPSMSDRKSGTVFD